MPLKTYSRTHKRARTRVLPALVAAFLFALASSHSDTTHAQRRRPQPPQGERPSRRVIVGGGSETANGSRVTITVDGPLNDYSAYRSGDRFYVVLPRSSAGGLARRPGGKGYSDMQVQQRGDDVIISYKVKPGAKARVEQKFNRLDVVFDVPEGAQQSPQQAGAQPSPTSESAGANAPPPNQATTHPTPTPNAAASRDVQSEAAAASPQGTAAQTPTPSSSATATPPAANNPSAIDGTQIAQAQPQQSSPVPVGEGASSTPDTFVGSTLLRSWPAALSAAVLVVTLGLFFIARRRRSLGRALREQHIRPRQAKREARPAEVEKPEVEKPEVEKPAPTPSPTPDAASQALADGAVLQNRYRVVRHLGRGGMGSVYEAADERLGRTVALKMMLARDAHLRRAFEREARILANLSHPALPRVTDHFGEGEEQFLVMDYVPGSDLKALLERQGEPFAEAEVLRWGVELLDALEYLHSHEPAVVHRDIKPSNLKLTAKRGMVLLDFGLAKGAVGQTASVTQSRSLMGYSPHFAPPEQMQGERTDPRSDLYSLAATLYTLLTCQSPPDALQRMTAQLNDEPDPLRPLEELNPAVSQRTSSVIMRALSLKPSQRWQSAADMGAALKGGADAATVLDAGLEQASTLRTSSDSS